MRRDKILVREVKSQKSESAGGGRRILKIKNQISKLWSPAVGSEMKNGADEIIGKRGAVEKVIQIVPLSGDSQHINFWSVS